MNNHLQDVWVLEFVVVMHSLSVVQGDALSLLFFFFFLGLYNGGSAYMW